MKHKKTLAKVLSLCLVLFFILTPRLLVHGQGNSNPGSDTSTHTSNPGSDSTIHSPNPGSDGDINLDVKLENPLPSITTIGGFIEKLLNIVLKIGVPIVTIFIIYAGFLFVSARGNEKKLQEAKDALLYTVIGAAVLLGAWVIASAIQGTVEGLQ